MSHDLNKKYTADEVRLYIFQMKSVTSSDPYGLPTRFYQFYWNTISNYIMDILNNKGSVSHPNKNFICLIPKLKKFVFHSDYHHISMCNVILKIVTKTIANCIKPQLKNIVKPFQSTFNLDRLITNNNVMSY